MLMYVQVEPAPVSRCVFLFFLLLEISTNTYRLYCGFPIIVYSIFVEGVCLNSYPALVVGASQRLDIILLHFCIMLIISVFSNIFTFDCCKQAPLACIVCKLGGPNI